MKAFVEHFQDYIPHIIVEAQIGLGPAGELRYPSYPLVHVSFFAPISYSREHVAFIGSRHCASLLTAIARSGTFPASGSFSATTATFGVT